MELAVSTLVLRVSSWIALVLGLLAIYSGFTGAGTSAIVGGVMFALEGGLALEYIRQSGKLWKIIETEVLREQLRDEIKAE